MGSSTDCTVIGASFAGLACSAELYQKSNSEDPCNAFVRSYPDFRIKRLLRFAFDHFQSDAAFNLLLGTRPTRAAAGIVYFHRKGVFNPPGRD